MRSAALVVIRAGHGRGLLWELKQAFEKLDPTKLLILVLNMKRRDYAAFREEMSKNARGCLSQVWRIHRVRSSIRLCVLLVRLDTQYAAVIRAIFAAHDL